MTRDPSWFTFLCVAHVGGQDGVYEVEALENTPGAFAITSIVAARECVPGCGRECDECRTNLEPRLLPLERADLEDAAHVEHLRRRAGFVAHEKRRALPITQDAATGFGRGLSLVKVLATLGGSFAVERSDGWGFVAFTTDGKGAPVVERDVSGRVTRRAAALRAKRAAEQHGDGTCSA